MTDEEILRNARENFRKVYNAELDIRNTALENLKFVYNVEEGQWPKEVREARIRNKRPCQTHNKIRKYVSLVVNRERDMMQSINVVPVDDKADPQVAKILNGIIRQIEYSSNADLVYTTAGEFAIACGFGYWRILTKYVDDSFDQEIYIDVIENPFSCYLDPRDMYAFIREALPVKEFKALYPNAKIVDFKDALHLGEHRELWWEEDKIYIAEYFEKIPVTKRLVRLVTPEGNLMDMYLDDPQLEEQLLFSGYQIVKEREVKTHKIMWYKITGAEILERNEWPGKYIPIVEVKGDTVNIGGKIYKRSLIEDAKDPQRMYNYWLSSLTEKVALVPKAPFLVTPQEIAGFEDMWKRSNEENQPYLLHNPTNLGRPSRQPSATVDTGALGLINLANNDIKDTTGIFEAAIGEASNERTGKAIIVRQMRSDMTVYHFPDNLRRAIIQTGKILIDLIPKIYDTERVIRIRGEDNSEEIVEINKVILNERGEPIRINDLSVGKYDVRADIKKYSTRRQEAADFMIQVMQYAPEIAPFIADLVFKYTDTPGADELEKRIKMFMQAKFGINVDELSTAIGSVNMARMPLKEQIGGQNG